MLQPKPDISSKYQSARVKKGLGDDEEVEGDAGGEEAPPKRMKSATKWDWLYKVGVQKVREQQSSGRKQDDIIFEREQHHYTFSPNKHIQPATALDTSSDQKLRLSRVNSSGKQQISGAKGPSKPGKLS